MKKIPLSVALIVKNEEKNISDCLETVKWADEIVVLDGFSIDKTVEIAGRYTDKIHRRHMDKEGIHRNFLYSLCRNEWILTLDADERVTPELKDEIETVLLAQKNRPDKNAYSIPIKTYIGKRWAKHAGWYPGSKVRLFRKGKFRYDETHEVHPRVFIDGNSGFLKGDIVHYAHRGFADLFRNTNEQTTLQAREWYKSGKKFSFFTLFRTPIDRFIRKFFFKGGVKGGFLGFILSVDSALYQFLSYVKLWELYNQKDEEGER